MAKVINNEKGFKVIEINAADAKICNFGFPPTLLVCDNCNSDITNTTSYYVAVLNRVLCKNCYDNWYKNAKRYDEDIRYEMSHFNYYADRLGL